MPRSSLSALALVLLAACGAPPAPAPAPPSPPSPPPVDAAVVVVAAPPDAALPDGVVTAPAWIFRYHTADRGETWTLRYADARALLEVDRGQGAPMRYTGTATDAGDALALDVATTSAHLALSCKHTKRALGRKCNDTKAKPIEVLDCYHPDFAQPMPFGHEPGIEYVVDATCNGYRTIGAAAP